jgi:hypothetical protein
MAEFVFVNNHGPNQQQDKRNGKIVRSHVMKEVQSRSRDAKNLQTYATADMVQADDTHHDVNHLDRADVVLGGPINLCRISAPENCTQEVMESDPGLIQYDYRTHDISLTMETSSIGNGTMSEFTMCRVDGCNASVEGTMLCYSHYVACQTPLISRGSTIICWRFDPFISFPVIITPEIRQVLDHGQSYGNFVLYFVKIVNSWTAFTDCRRNIIFYRNAQLPNSLMCAASFHQVIANILKWMRLNGDRPGSQSYEEKYEISHHTKALKSIRALMAVGVISEGLICAG